MSESIHKYLKLAEQSGKRFAYKNQKYEPECIAEAYYILTVVILKKFELFKNAEKPEVFLKVCIANGLRDYFRDKYDEGIVGVTTDDGQIVGAQKEDPTNDYGLIDELQCLFPDQPDIIRLWRQGFALEDMLFVNTQWFKTVKDMIKVKRTLSRSRKTMRRKMETAGLGVSRDDIYDLSVTKTDGSVPGSQ